MIKHVLSLLVGFGFLLVVTVSQAVPFNSFDPKSMAMGGAGVAVASPGSAPFFNPALMSIADKDDDFALELPILGGRLADPNDFIDAADNVNDAVFDTLDAEINTYNGSPGTASPVLNALSDVNNEILKLSDKAAQFELNGGMVVGIPSEDFGIAFSVSAGASFTGVLSYKDASTVANLTSDLNELDDCFLIPAGPAQDQCFITNASRFFFVDTDPASGTFKQIVFTAQSDSGPTSDILSTARFVGIGFVEVGLTLSREFYVAGDSWAVGVTPKSVSISVIDYEANADSLDTDSIDSANFTTDYTDFNIDVGVARDFDNGWRAGFVIKNLISYDYEAFRTDTSTNIRAATGTEIAIRPQARVGVSHANDWSVVTVDLDITENDALGSLAEFGKLGDASRYLAMGVELDVFDTAQLRFGYRADLVNSDRNVVSAGFGLSPFGVHIDVAVAGNADEVGGSLQLGFRF